MHDYRKAMIHVSELGTLDLHYYRFDSKSALDRLEQHGKSHGKWKKNVLEKGG